MGNDRSADVPYALQTRAAHQEVHQNRCSVSSFLEERFTDLQTLIFNTNVV